MGKEITFYTDGSCLNNPGRGGWAFYTTDGYNRAGPKHKTTNNEMELTAVYESIKYFVENYNNRDQMTIYCDSMYVVNGINKYMENWYNDNFELKPKHHKNLWIEVHKLWDYKTMTIEWVKSHNGNEFNEKVDKLARHMAIISQ